MQKPSRTLKHKLNLWTLMVVQWDLEGKNEYLKDYDMSGQEKTIKTLKMIKNIENCSIHIGKGSRSMFARQLDIRFYIVNKVVKQNL